MPASRLSTAFYFRAALERSFLLAAAGVVLDLGLAAVGILAHSCALIRSRLLTSSSHSTADGADALWPCTLKWYVMLLLLAVLSWQRYILLRGPLGTWKRLLLAVGLGLSSLQPGDHWWHGSFWRQRLPPANAACIIPRVPAVWYWWAGAVCWLAATLLDAADPQVTCGQSLLCRFNALSALAVDAAATAADHPFLQAQKAMAVLCSSSSLTHLADVLLLGLLLSYFELQLRRSWAAVQGLHDSCEIHHDAAVAAAPAGPVVHAGQYDVTQRTMQAVVAGPAEDATSATKQQAAATSGRVLHAAGKLKHEHKSQAIQHLCCAPDAQEQETCSRRSTAAPQRTSPGQDTDKAASPAPAASAAAEAVAAAKAGTAAGSSNASAEAVPPATPPNMPPGGAGDVAGEGASRLGRSPTVSQTAACARLPAPCAVLPVAAVDLAGVRPKARRSALYVSPMRSMVVSFKLQHPPHAGAADYDRLKHGFAAALQSHISTAAAAASTGAAAAAGPETPVCLVTECATFRGCHQLVFQAVTGPTGSSDANPQCQLLLQQLAERLLQEWPEWSVMDVQLLQPPNPPATAEAAAAVVHTPLQSRLVDLAMGAGLYLQPVALALPLQPVSMPLAEVGGGGSSSHSSAGNSTDSNLGHGSGSSSPSGWQLQGEVPKGAAAVAELCVAGSVVEQLVWAGYSTLRVVVSLQPQGVQLLDNTWDLPSASSPPAAPASSASAGQDMHLQLLLPGAALTSEDYRRHGAPYDDTEHQVLSVVVLARGRRSTGSQDLIAPAVAADSAKTAETAGAAGLPGGSPRPPSTPPLAAAALVAAAAAARASTVIARLPLLVLAKDVQQELQQLLEAAMSDGLTYQEAYEDLLPLLQDWALLLQLLGRTDAAALLLQQPGDAVIGVHDAVFAAVAACFAEHGMKESLKLLLLLQEQQQQQHQDAQRQPARLHDSAATVEGGGEEGALAKMGSAGEPTLATVLEAVAASAPDQDAAQLPGAACNPSKQML